MAAMPSVGSLNRAELTPVVMKSGRNHRQPQASSREMGIGPRGYRSGASLSCLHRRWPTLPSNSALHARNVSGKQEPLHLS
jgi:hypothetical protein